MVAQIQALREDGFDAAFLDKQQIQLLNKNIDIY
jgi:hypothetical protein